MKTYINEIGFLLSTILLMNFVIFTLNYLNLYLIFNGLFITMSLWGYFLYKIIFKYN